MTASSSDTGATTVAPAVTLDELAAGIRADLDAIEGDNRSALEHAIAAGEKLRQAKAQVARGEWLPWLATNFPGHPTTARDYMRLANPANGVRALDLGSVREALAALPKRTKQTNPASGRARSRTGGANARQAWQDDDVLVWAARRLARGATVEDLVRDSDAGAHDWPLDGKGLGQNAAEKCRAIVEDRRRRGDTNRTRKPTEAGKRLRDLHAAKRDGTRTTTDLWHLQVAVAKAVAILENFDLPDLDWSEQNDYLVSEIHDDLGRHLKWAHIALDAVVAHMPELSRRRKLTYLDARAVDPSSEPPERANAARLAERLRARGASPQIGA